MAKVETEIKNVVRAAQINKSYNIDCEQVGKGHLKLTLPSGIEVRLIAQSVFSRSFYRVFHPRFGNWEGMLNSVSCKDGEFGYNIGKPKRMSN